MLLDKHTPPGCDNASSLAATLTPSPRGSLLQQSHHPYLNQFEIP